MKRAFRYDGRDMDKQACEYTKTTCQAIHYMRKRLNRSVTENGAVGFKTTQHPLVDLNFMVSSLRWYSEEMIVKEFVKAYYESPKYAVKWLFFLRDIMEGMGERRTFRVCMKYLAQSHAEIARVVLPLIPKYGRYDDWLVFLDTDLCEETCKLIKRQLEEDREAMEQGKQVSLLAKWLPSVNTSSKDTRRLARLLAGKLGMNERAYRKVLSALRAYSNVVEVDLSANRWDAVSYDKLPAKANMKYAAAFVRHDRERRAEYLLQVMNGEAKLNGKGIMPYEVVHRMMKGGWYEPTVKDDLLSELMWRQLQEQGFDNEWGFEDCIVVADGSGSMYSHASGDTSVQAIEICDALAIYFAEQLKGVFHNKAITFSHTPQLIDLDKGKNLKEKLEIMLAYNEVANTNIEAVFDLLLDMAVENRVPAEEMPGQVLIISDMEFDAASEPEYWHGMDREWNKFTPALFDVIEARFQAAGYHMPRLIFWNVCGRTQTIPKVDSEQGICLLSGFAPNAMKIAAKRDKKDPYECLIQVLDRPRYEPVESAVAGLVA